MMLPKTIARLRLLVGYLGEKPQLGWWGSNFLGPSSEAFLAPVFSRSALLAQYRGVCEAALLVHDERIGIGANYHLFRLPDALEREAAIAVTREDFGEGLRDAMQSVESALQGLAVVQSPTVERSEGPTSVGRFDYAELQDLLAGASAHYHKAFAEGYQCFPFLKGA